MICRPIVHFEGQPASGKTTLIEALLNSDYMDIICARGVRDKSIRRPHESRPRDHQELKRYRSAGASNIVLYRFPQADNDSFYESEFMSDWSEAVVTEGDSPHEWPDLRVFVARPPEPRKGLLRKAKRSHAQAHKRTLDIFEAVMGGRDSLFSILSGNVGEKESELEKKGRRVTEQIQKDLAAEIARLRKTPPPAPTMHWSIRPDYRGIERAQVVVVNIRDEAERKRAERLVEDVKRLRSDEAIFRDVFDFTGSRVPITAVVADLSNPKGPGLRKVLTRIRRTLRNTG